jgi:acyl-coenzyme A synthetase/AMP-(fatty) acid ligase
MPRDVGEALAARFAPTRIIELYATTEANAMLVNAAGKPGSCGRPLPGSAMVVLAAWDVAAGELVREGDGRGRAVPPGQTGMLLARVEAARHGGDPARLVHEVFAAGDVWHVSGSLMRQDAEGDFALVARAGEAVLGAHGQVVPAAPIEQALARLPGVSLAACGRRDGQLIAFVQGRAPTGAEVEVALATIALDERPGRICVVPRIPLSAGYRPLTAGLAIEAALMLQPDGQYQP